jgi:A/G-specific adenine glycosylase
MKKARRPSPRQKSSAVPETSLSPIAHDLLGWYDVHQRALPWRATHGAPPNPYHVWLSEIMLQQTTVAAVKPYYEKFIALFPTVTAMADAHQEEIMRAWAGLGYYSRARNLHACAQHVVSAFQGQFPDTYEDLKALPGIGDYTAAAILTIAFGKRAIVIDGNVERVVSRLERIDIELPKSKPLIRSFLEPITPHIRPGDFAQSMMDLGATICTPRSPSCGLCPLKRHCRSAHREDVETFPRKAPKKSRPKRYGHAFLVTRADNTILLRTRSEKGLLGGMSEVPTTPWTDRNMEASPESLIPIKGRWQTVAEPVRHVFTHFELELTVHVAQVNSDQPAPSDMRFTALADLAQEALPSVMTKVIKTGLEGIATLRSR